MAENTEEKGTRKTAVKAKGLTLAQKLIEVRKTVDYLQKTATGSQFNYTSSSQVLASVRTAMNEQSVLLLSQIDGHELSQNLTKTGTISFFTELAMTMTWMDAETGETIVLPWYAQGVDLAGEKGVGKALTYAEKYFILKQFNIPTDKDDPDAFQDKNLPQVDIKTKLIGDLNEATDQGTVNKIWSGNAKFKTDPDFVEAVKKATSRLKPVAPKAEEPKS